MTSDDRNNQDIYADKDIFYIASTSRTTEDMLQKLTVSKEEIRDIERDTVGQSKNEIWRRLRKGRITASNFYRVHTKMESLKKNPSTDSSKLVASLINPPDISHLSQIAQGNAKEKPALKKLFQLLSKNHRNLAISECGLYLSEVKPYLGASPDGLVSCDCCQPALVEIKCPTLELDCLSYLDEAKYLKTRTNYFGQVQGQMAITRCNKTYFFIFYSEDLFHLQVIEYDKSFVESMLGNLTVFFHGNLLPAILDEPPPPMKKRKTAVITLD